MSAQFILDQAGLGTLLLEGIKYLVRLLLKNPEYNFPKSFYLIFLPVANVIAGVILAFLGVSGYEYPTDWLAWVKGLVVVLISSLISVLIYNQGLRPLKEYTKAKADAGVQEAIGVPATIEISTVEPTSSRVRKPKK